LVFIFKFCLASAPSDIFYGVARVYRNTSLLWWCEHSAQYQFIMMVRAFSTVPVYYDGASIQRSTSLLWWCEHSAQYQFIGGANISAAWTLL